MGVLFMDAWKKNEALTPSSAHNDTIIQVLLKNL